MIIGNVVFWLASGYIWIGIAVAAAFLAFGLDRLDAAARTAYGFRPLLVPGLTLLWPIVVAIWWRRAGTAKEN